MTRIIIAALLLAASGFGNFTYSQTAVSAQAFAEVVSTLTAQETEPLTFGRFSPQVNGGRIIVNPDGTFISEGSVMVGQTSLSPGAFYITGEPQTTFSIQLPNAPTVLVHQGSNNVMVVESFKSDPPAQIGAVINTDGSQMVRIGAELQVGTFETNPVGMYTGSFELVFAYN
jgi:hypothetical protein